MKFYFWGKYFHSSLPLVQRMTFDKLSDTVFTTKPLQLTLGWGQPRDRRDTKSIQIIRDEIYDGDVLQDHRSRCQTSQWTSSKRWTDTPTVCLKDLLSPSQAKKISFAVSTSVSLFFFPAQAKPPCCEGEFFDMLQSYWRSEQMLYSKLLIDMRRKDVQNLPSEWYFPR